MVIKNTNQEVNQRKYEDGWDRIFNKICEKVTLQPKMNHYECPDCGNVVYPMGSVHHCKS